MSMYTVNARACTSARAANASLKETTINYNITGGIKGKRIIIVDDVFTSGQSLTDYKEEIERCGGEVVAAIFYGKTVTVPPLFLIKAHVWGGHIIRAITYEP